VDGDLVVSAGLRIAAAELAWRFSRSSGPGGQGVNTADSRVELIWDAVASPALAGLPDAVRARVLDRLDRRLVDGEVRIVAAQFRSQVRNREAARRRLAALLREALAPPPPVRRPTRPSRAARLRRLEDKRRRSQTKRLRRPEA
jgi:ribosome-associated protein